MSFPASAKTSVYVSDLVSIICAVSHVPCAPVGPVGPVSPCGPRLDITTELPILAWLEHT